MQLETEPDATIKPGIDAHVKRSHVARSIKEVKPLPVQLEFANTFHSADSRKGHPRAKEFSASKLARMAAKWTGCLDTPARTPHDPARRKPRRDEFYLAKFMGYFRES